MPSNRVVGVDPNLSRWKAATLLRNVPNPIWV